MAQLTKRQTTIVLLLLAASFIGYATYCYRFRIWAVAWHVLYGDSIAVSGYRIAVPSHWFVERPASDDDARMRNARTGESVWFHSFPKPPNFTLALWSDLVQKRMNDSNDSESPIVGKRELDVAGERFVCFERDFEKKAMKGIHLPSVECKSAGPLDVTLFGGMRKEPRRDYPEFYSLMASVRKLPR
ncbi:MAG: hypothetical protein WB683_14980 [Candidatus Sulfotelmatobacter sp.]